jgi:hypothetical protein
VSIFCFMLALAHTGVRIGLPVGIAVMLLIVGTRVALGVKAKA